MSALRSKQRPQHRALYEVKLLHKTRETYGIDRKRLFAFRICSASHERRVEAFLGFRSTSLQKIIIDSFYLFLADFINAAIKKGIIIEIEDAFMFNNEDERWNDKKVLISDYLMDNNYYVLRQHRKLTRRISWLAAHAFLNFRGGYIWPSRY